MARSPTRSSNRTGSHRTRRTTTPSCPSTTPTCTACSSASTDLQFLRGLARRDGKLCRVACTDTPGDRTGYFITPDLSGDPVTTITLSDPTAWSVDSLDFEWDVMRPTEVDASQLRSSNHPTTATAGDATDSGLAPLSTSATPTRDFPTYANVPPIPAGDSGTLLLTPTADVPEVPLRATAALRDAGWFMRCTGEADVLRLGNTLRVGTVVAVVGAGALQSGNWFVWSVRHKIMIDQIKLEFTLVRNAIGAPPSSGGGLSLPGGL